MVKRADYQALHDTIGLVYDSALDPSLWPAALAAMCELVDGCSGVILIHDTVRREMRNRVEWNTHADWPKWSALLDQKYAPMMPFYGMLQMAEIGEVYSTAQMAAMIGRGDDIYDEPFFQEWALPAGLRDNIASVLMKSPNRFATMALHTSVDRALIGPRQLAIGKLLAPHVRRAVVIGDLLNMATTLQSTLDMLNTAIVVTDAEARVVHTNSAGDILLREDVLIGVEHGQLRAQLSPATNALRRAIAQTTGPAGLIGGNGIDVPLRRTDATSAIAHVLPLAQGGPARDWGPRATAAVFVAPVDVAQPTAAALTALYGLTPMEAKVLLQITSGKKRREAAETLGIADSTAKSHLDRVFEKTGTGDQAALSRLVATLVSPARVAR